MICAAGQLKQMGRIMSLTYHSLLYTFHPIIIALYTIALIRYVQMYVSHDLVCFHLQWVLLGCDSGTNGVCHQMQ